MELIDTVDELELDNYRALLSEFYDLHISITYTGYRQKSRDKYWDTVIIKVLDEKNVNVYTRKFNKYYTYEELLRIAINICITREMKFQ